MFKSIMKNAAIIGVVTGGITAAPIIIVWLAVKLSDFIFNEAFWLLVISSLAGAVIVEVYKKRSELKRLAKVVRYGRREVESREMDFYARAYRSNKDVLKDEEGEYTRCYVPVCIDIPKSYTKHAVLTAHNKSSEVLLGGDSEKDFHIWNARAIGLSDMVIAPIGWEESPLVKREITLALRLGIPVEYMEVQDEQKAEEKDDESTRSSD